MKNKRIKSNNVYLTKYPVAGNNTLPSIVCPDKYWSSSVLKSTLMTVSPDPDSCNLLTNH